PNALVESGLQAGEQYCKARCQHEHQHVLHRQRDLRKNAAQLAEQGLDLQDSRRGKVAGELYQFSILADWQVEAGHIGGWYILQGVWLEDHVEVGLEAIPVNFAQAGNADIAEIGRAACRERV